MSKPVYHHYQKGLATLMLTLVLLLLSVLIAYYTSSGAIQEQRIAANYVRAKQAAIAAQAGIDFAVDYMKNGGLDHDNNGSVDTLTPTPLVASGTSATYKVAYCAPTDTTRVCPNSSAGTISCTAPTSTTSVQAFSCGWSDDGTAVQMASQIVQGTPGTGGGKMPPLPLTARGNANLLVGGASILNFFNDLTVWSGGTFFGQSMTGKTFVRNTATNPIADSSFDFRNTGNSPACNNPPSGYVCSTQGAATGHDVVQGDTNLSGLTVSDLFQSYFNTTQDDYRDNVAAWKVDLNNGLTNENSTDVSSAYGKTDTSIWINGDATIDGTIGAAGKPVILIVSGNLTLGPSAQLNGMVFVTGNLSTNGTPTVYGSITTGGNANATGNMKVVYDPFNGTGAPPCGATCQLGTPSRVPGSWKDW